MRGPSVLTPSADAGIVIGYRFGFARTRERDEADALGESAGSSILPRR